jgi:hypothetical protein
MISTFGVALVLGGQGRAAVLSTTPNIEVLPSPPERVYTGALESDSFIRAFAERKAVVLPGAVFMNVTKPGYYAKEEDFTGCGGHLAAGTVVDSYLLHVDPVDTHSVSLEGSITFDRDILGLAVFSKRLRRTDSLLGAPGTNYGGGTTPQRGMEFGGDRIWLSEDRRTVSIKMNVANWRDELRVVTTAILTVDIDIKPGTDPNAINLGSNGVIPVAILSSETFDASTVDADTVTLAGATVAVRGKASNLMAHLEDVNADGLPDLVVHVETENLDPNAFQEGYAFLSGLTYDGEQFEGSDEIFIVPPEQ